MFDKVPLYVWIILGVLSLLQMIGAFGLANEIKKREKEANKQLEEQNTKRHKVKRIKNKI